MDLSKCYLHTLGEAEAALLADLRSRIPDIVAKAKASSAEAAAKSTQTIWGVDVEKQSEASDIVLLKYIRAEEKNLDIAADRITQTLIFRADCGMDEMMKAELPEHFQGFDEFPGLDYAGRPVSISHFGNMDIDKVFGDTEAFIRFRVYVMEKAISHLSFKKGEPEDLCQVHNYAGVIMSMFKPKVKEGVSALSKILERHYPELKGVTLFVNFPNAFSRLWKTFAAVLPERTVKKIAILGHDDYEALFERLQPGLVPESLGGLFRSTTSKCRSPAQVVVVKARGTEEVMLHEVQKAPQTVAYELRVCAADIAYAVIFSPADGSAEVTVQSSKPSELLQSTDGVVAGDYECPSAGRLSVRFHNTGAWFKQRVCAARIETVGS